MPPAPKCIQRKMFLPVTDSHLPFQDYWLKQPQRTLAYAQALQYRAEKANPLVPDEPYHLAMCVHELRWLMKLYMIFSDCDIFKGLICNIPEAKVEGAAWLNSIEPVWVDSPTALTTAPSAQVDGSATLIITPAIPMEEFVTPVTCYHPHCISGRAGQTPTLPETTSDVRGLTEPEYPKWVKVHLFHPVAFMGSLPSTRVDLKWCHHSCCSSWR